MLRREKKILSINEAVRWAKEYTNMDISRSNILYLIQYGKIKKFNNNRSVYVLKEELKNYYDSFYGKRELKWKKELGEDLNWHLSFDFLRESDTTKHVHRLHPYKGKFIPQLVEYFIDSHTDRFKDKIYFNKGDVILDPFCGSGTTLVQANELGIHAVGIDVSAFNTMISNAKIKKYDLFKLEREIRKITSELNRYEKNSSAIDFEQKLLEKLNEFNYKYFPSPDFKLKVKRGEVNEKEYGEKKAKEFLPIYKELLKEYNITLRQERNGSFLDKWYFKNVRKEIDFVFELIKKIKDQKIKRILAIILSRTIRSCRATTHSDLATLKKPVYQTYYCRKHKKICKPLFTITRWWNRYSKDTIKRLSVFQKIRTDTFQICLNGDSKKINIISELEKKNERFAKKIRNEKIKGIFSSPPYVGLINYHEQHAYSYDLFGFKRKDELEIGPLFRGKGREARESYVEGVSDVLRNSSKYLVKDYDIFLVANDKYNLYPKISKKAGMKIVKEYKRPVLNRTEKDKSAYSETIFHLKEE